MKSLRSFDKEETVKGKKKLARPELPASYRQAEAYDWEK